MKLMIDRMQQDPYVYRVRIGYDWEQYIVEVFRYNFPKSIKENKRSELIELDKLMTNLPDLTFSLLNVRHPLVQLYFDVEGIIMYRLKHGNRYLELLEFGDRLF